MIGQTIYLVDGNVKVVKSYVIQNKLNQTHHSGKMIVDTLCIILYKIIFVNV